MFKIPLPNYLGMNCEIEGEKGILEAVTWDNDEPDIRFIYHQEDELGSAESREIVVDKPDYTLFFAIPTSLLQVRPFKEHGFPVPGCGSISGIALRDGRLNAILESPAKDTLTMCEVDEHMTFIKRGLITQVKHV